MARMPRPSQAQQLEQLKLKTSILGAENTSAREQNEETTVDSARARSRIRRMGESVERRSRDIDSEVEHLEWSVELAGQERAKLQAKIAATQASLEAAIAKYAQEVSQKRIEHAEQEALLKAELQMYSTELESLREFEGQRVQMEEECRHLNQTLMQNRQAHLEMVEQLHLQLKREQDQYERENRRRVKEAQQAALNLKDESLEAAAIRCIQDSQAVSHQLRKNQFKSRDILNANNELVKKIDGLKRENLLLTEREKMLIDDVAKYRQKIEAMKLKMSEDEVAQTKERAKVETDCTIKIEALEKQCVDAEKANAELENQISLLHQRIEEIEGQRRMSSNKQSQLMRLMTSTAPSVLDSLKSVQDDTQPAPLQALIMKLSEALEDGEAAERAQAAHAEAPQMASAEVQTAQPNRKLI
jgi:hypothetical protein